VSATLGDALHFTPVWLVDNNTNFAGSPNPMVAVLANCGVLLGHVIMR